MIAFTPFPSIARLSRDMVITEKLDGTNASVVVTPVPPEYPIGFDEVYDAGAYVLVSDAAGQLFSIHAGSRNRWINPKADNYGFARWVWANARELVKLGPGAHFGEWWGQGIQRGYGLTEKRFSLFNTGRWNADNVPTGVHVVPVLAIRTFDTSIIDAVLAGLANGGSMAAPGFYRPEGVVVFHAKSGTLFKKTLDHNDGHKGTT